MEELGVSSYIRDLRLAFQSFLRRPDEKQCVLSSFQQAFNSLETDLRYDDDAKAELLLRNEELRDALWRIVSPKPPPAKAPTPPPYTLMPTLKLMRC